MVLRIDFKAILCNFSSPRRWTVNWTSPISVTFIPLVGLNVIGVQGVGLELKAATDSDR
jgi:hypothetical protein